MAQHQQQNAVVLAGILREKTYVNSLNDPILDNNESDAVPFDVDDSILDDDDDDHAITKDSKSKIQSTWSTRATYKSDIDASSNISINTSTTIATNMNTNANANPNTNTNIITNSNAYSYSYTQPNRFNNNNNINNTYSNHRVYSQVIQVSQF